MKQNIFEIQKTSLFGVVNESRLTGRLGRGMYADQVCYYIASIGGDAWCFFLK